MSTLRYALAREAAAIDIMAPVSSFAVSQGRRRLLSQGLPIARVGGQGTPAYGYARI